VGGPWALDDLVARLRVTELEEVAVVSRPGGLEIIGIDRV
jgi:hypothetical protein